MYVFLQISKSNEKQVALNEVRRELTGYYKCEVSADAPSFHTDIKSALVIIIGKLSENLSRVCREYVEVIFRSATDWRVWGRGSGLGDESKSRRVRLELIRYFLYIYISRQMFSIK